MKKQILEMLNEMNFRAVDSLSFDNKKKEVVVELTDHSGKSHQIKLQGVENYHYMDEEVEEGELNADEPIKFYENLGRVYASLMTDSQGNVVNTNLITPNFVINSKDSSIVLSAEKIIVDGFAYETSSKEYM